MVSRLRRVKPCDNLQLPTSNRGRNGASHPAHRCPWEDDLALSLAGGHYSSFTRARGGGLWAYWQRACHSV